MDYIERAITPALLERAASYPAVFVTGPRQSGKSTLVRHAFPNHTYISLEEPDVRRFAVEDPRGFLHQYGEQVILDEAQRAPELFSYLQTRIDEHDSTGMYILSGSQNFLMMDSISQSLAGRVGILNLLPFSLSELDEGGYPPSSSERWMIQGAYPRAITMGISPDIFYADYLQTYIERDVRNETTVRDLARFRDFLTACAAKVGSLINLTNIGRDIGADARTVSSWLSILEESYICFRLTPYYSSVGNRHTKNAKLYFYDTGLLCYLLGIATEPELSASAYIGNVFENAVIAEKSKQYLNSGKKPSMFFWRDSASKEKEIDLIIESAHNHIDLYEIKASMTSNRSYLDTMLKFAARSNSSCAINVIYRGQDQLSSDGPSFINWRSLGG